MKALFTVLFLSSSLFAQPQKWDAQIDSLQALITQAAADSAAARVSRLLAADTLLDSVVVQSIPHNPEWVRLSLEKLTDRQRIDVIYALKEAEVRIKDLKPDKAIEIRERYMAAALPILLTALRAP